MVNNAVVNRYAHAMFKMGQEFGAKDMQKYGAVLSALSDAMRSSAQLTSVFHNPMLEVGEKKNVVLALLKELSAGDIERQFCFLLADKNRLDCLPAISDAYNALLDEAEGISRGIFTTALEIDTKRQSSIKQSLEKQTGRKLILNFVVNPTILGGAVLKIGDLVMDSSLLTQLENLRETIKRGGGE